MERGYIRFWRKIKNCGALYERGKVYSKMEAWIDIVAFQANGVERDGMGRGEFRASYRYLAVAWNWETTRVFRFIHSLEQSGMLSRNPLSMQHLTQHSAQREVQRFIVCNYELYNPTRNTDRNTECNTDRNKSNKGIKEGFNEGLNKNNVAAGAAPVDSLPSVESFQLSERLRTAIATRDPNAKAAKLPDLTHWARDIDKLMLIDGRRAEDIGAIIGWCQKPGCFWGPNILSGKKLREKFDTLWGQMHRGEGKATNGKSSDRSGPSGDPGSTSEQRTSRGERIYIPKQV